jgi:hypothetical protein
MLSARAKVDRRKYSRFRVQDGAYVILKPSDIGVGRLLDISIAGLTFDYVTGRPPGLDATQLDIFLVDPAIHIHDLPCHLVWDLKIYEIPTTYLHKRRCGVQFGQLTPEQTFQIEHLIKHHTTSNA